MATTRILVVDDEHHALALCEDTSSTLPQVEIVLEQQSPRAADRIRREKFDLVITDLRISNLNSNPDPGVGCCGFRSRSYNVIADPRNYHHLTAFI